MCTPTAIDQADMARMPFVGLQGIVSAARGSYFTRDEKCAFALMEMWHRAYGPAPEAYDLIWQVVFGDERPVPAGLQAPSEAWPAIAARRPWVGF